MCLAPPAAHSLHIITLCTPGGSLSDYLARHAVCEDVARYFFKQLVEALSFCHSRKIVYRDVKPANVLITGTHPPFLKMCDFGLVSGVCCVMCVTSGGM